jgi:hypothetical protein
MCIADQVRIRVVILPTLIWRSLLKWTGTELKSTAKKSLESAGLSTQTSTLQQRHSCQDGGLKSYRRSGAKYMSDLERAGQDL